MDTIAPETTTSASPSCRVAGGCCSDMSSDSVNDPSRSALIREAFQLEWLTVGWMVIEATVGIGAAVMAGSLVLLAFGLDSIIELISAGMLIWRLWVELRHGQAFSEAAERMASRIGGALLFVLAAYVVASAGWSLWHRRDEALSTAGLVLALLAIPIMRYLATCKIAVADRLGSRAMRVDAMESLTCGWLSLVVVVSLAAQALLGAWWIDPIGSLAIVWFLIREGREAWSGEECACN